MDENQEKELTNENKEPEKTPNQEEKIVNEEPKQEEITESAEEPKTEPVVEEKPEVVQEEAKTETAIEEKALDETKEEKKRKKKEARKAKRKKGSYITGTIGAILGGLVAAIPWIITYSLANMVIAAIAALIAGGAFLGYKIFRGKVGRYLPAIITVVSLLIVISITTIVCPIILMIKSSYPITFENWLGLFTDVRAEIRLAIIEDTAIAIIFTILGVWGLMRLIRQKLKDAINEEDKSPKRQKAYQKLREKLLEQTETVKKVCSTMSAMSQENAVTKKEILNAMKTACGLKTRKAKKYFKMALSYKLLKKYNGKYYYDETDEKYKLQNVKKFKRISTRKRRIIITLIVIVLVATAGYLIYRRGNYYVLAETDIILVPNEDQDFFGTKDEITVKYGETAAKYYDFIMEDKAKTYELYGQRIPKSQYGEKEFGAIIQEDKEYYEPYIGKDVMSEVTDKTLGEQNFKSYTYTYTGQNGNQYKAAIYLCEDTESYLWINVYADFNIEFTTIDTIVDNLIEEK